MAATSKPKTSERELVITRTFDAPPERVFNAWTDPELFAKWWGPKDFTAPNPKMDVREGGKYLWCMRGPDGKEYYSTGVYREIVPFERLVLTDAFADAQGNVVPASYHGLSGDWPDELLITVTFESNNGKTKMTLRQTGIPDGEMTEMTSEGWNGSLDKLAESLK